MYDLVMGSRWSGEVHNAAEGVHLSHKAPIEEEEGRFSEGDLPEVEKR